MGTTRYVFVLYVISFLDALCFGLVMPVLPPYILSLGGDHKILGLLGMLHMLLQLFSVPFGQSYSDKYGKKVSLLATLCIGVLTNILMGVVTKYASVIIVRMIFYLTNQTQTFCKAFVADLQAKENHSGIYARMNLLGVLGFIIGPIAGGHMLDKQRSFYFISLTTVVLTQVALLLAVSLPGDSPKSSRAPRTNLARKLADNLMSSYRSLQDLQIRTNWNIVLLKIYTTISLTVFFMKFALLLKVLHGKDNTGIGYTVAYQNVFIFLASFLIPISDRIYGRQSVKKLSHSLSLLTISIANVCYAPTYVMYLVCFIPLTVAKCVFDSAFREISSTTSLGDLSRSLDTVTTITGIVTPPILGYFCDYYNQNAVKAFSIIPLAIAMFVMHFSTKKQLTKFKLN